MYADENQDNLQELVTTIWDHIYINGPQSVSQIAEHMQLPVETVDDLVTHAWFTMEADRVAIATESQ